ncbi:hypothetical protein HaLaN_26769 [Haematococcus lacustris]|uniref:Uncharacterized protein n=1 Tax=Haematococcus lacustris TaxID=44745 RepID=A0A6A0A6Z0_HAELA|nr:hypothetical protein HaLaN_26769 [Haematococcus lacustris]
MMIAHASVAHPVFDRCQMARTCKYDIITSNHYNKYNQWSHACAVCTLWAHACLSSYEHLCVRHVVAWQRQGHAVTCNQYAAMKHAALERPIVQNVTVRVPGRLPVTVGASSSGAQAQARRRDKAFRVEMTSQLSPGTPQSQMSLTWWFNGRGDQLPTTVSDVALPMPPYSESKYKCLVAAGAHGLTLTEDCRLLCGGRFCTSQKLTCVLYPCRPVQGKPTAWLFAGSKPQNRLKRPIQRRDIAGAPCIP